MLIFLIGMMGSGKTTIGQMLADSLTLPFFDTDAIIENVEGSTVEAIFRDKGETYFRNLEAELVMHWKLSDGVIATGGGMPCFNNLMDILNEKGKTVYLETPLNVILNRLSQDDHRPLLKDKSPLEVKNLIKALLFERSPHYSKASVKIKTDLSPELSVKKIIKNIFK